MSQIKNHYTDADGNWTDEALAVLESSRSYEPLPCDEMSTYLRKSFAIIDAMDDGMLF
jgi:hypothetical protein